MTTLLIMEKRNTKKLILDTSLDLFSINGYESTSMSDIAEAVGIKKASLYAHYENKQAILDTLLSEIAESYNNYSMLNDRNFSKLNLVKTPKDLSKLVLNQVTYVVENPYISKIRKLLTIEQFRNDELSNKQSLYSYTNIMNYGMELIEYLIDNGIFKDGDVEIMAGKLVLPISMWIGVCDRQPNKEKEVLSLIERHVVEFYKEHRK